MNLRQCALVCCAMMMGLSLSAMEPRIQADTLYFSREVATAGLPSDITVHFKAARRIPGAKVEFTFPSWVNFKDATANLIGRGDVPLEGFETQYIGRHGPLVSFTTAGTLEIDQKGHRLVFDGLDLRPDNGDDLVIVLRKQRLPKAGSYEFSAVCTAPEGYKVGFDDPKYPDFRGRRRLRLERVNGAKVRAALSVIRTVTDFKREPLRGDFDLSKLDFGRATFSWTPFSGAKAELQGSTDGGATWTVLATPSPMGGKAEVAGLARGKDYQFRLHVIGGNHSGYSNITRCRTGFYDLMPEGEISDGFSDNTPSLNSLIAKVNSEGGGIIRLGRGEYRASTVLMLSNVWLYLEHGAIIRGCKGAEDPEQSYFPMTRLQEEACPELASAPDNFLHCQDEGHRFFRNSTFYACRQENMKIVGGGRISGNGVLTRENDICYRPEGLSADKLFGFKLCRDIEIGGLDTHRDMWYDEATDRPYYIQGEGKDFDDSPMMQIDQPGHFAFLFTQCDEVYSHDIGTGKATTGHDRDIYDFMACRDVRVYNLYCKATIDDVVKLGSDASLGFTRKGWNHLARNIIGDTGCFLIQVGTETQDDLTGLWVDNIYCTGSGKTAFSVHCDDGGTISDMHLNSGKTGPLHHRSISTRTLSPFVVDVVHNGRIIGATRTRLIYQRDGQQYNASVNYSVPLGRIENISVAHLDANEVYYGTSCANRERWYPFDGTQVRYTPMFTGYRIPSPEEIVSGDRGLGAADGRYTSYIKDITLEDVDLTVKGGYGPEAAEGVIAENSNGLSVNHPWTVNSFGLWVRHVENLTIKDFRIHSEKPDGRWPIVLDDVKGASVSGVKVDSGITEKTETVKLFNSENCKITE